MGREVPKVRRRSVLKGISAGVVGVGLSTTTAAAAQSSYSVSVSQSWGCDNDYGDVPIDGMFEYTVGAFGEVNPTGYTFKLEDRVPVPIERHNQGFTVDYDPCNYQRKYYDGLLPWWRDYANCNNLATEQDSNILTVRDHSGGKAYPGGKYGVVSGGNNWDDAPSNYQKYTLTDVPPDYPGIMSTTIHEMSHNLQRTDISFKSHQTGNSEHVSGYDYITPMGKAAQGGTNECLDSVANCEGTKNTWSQGCTIDDYWY